jgi:diketogulonate reductase-like aldo/keto reductase
VIAIPKASSVQHVRENRRALEIRLTPEDLAAIDAEFPAPKRKRPLEMI